MQSDSEAALKTREQPRSDYVIARLGSVDGLTALRESWETLTAEIPDCSFFLSWEWIDSWWRNLRGEHGLWLLTARNREGRLVGIAPLMSGRCRLGPLTLRRLSFLGSGLARPAHLDIVARAEEREALTAAFVRYLQDCGEEWDLLELEGLREDSPLVSVLAAATGRCLARDPVACSFVTLPATWEAFQEQAMSAKLRKTIRYYERRLEKDFPGQVTFEAVAAAADLQPALEFLFETSRSQFRQKGLVSCFEDRDFRRFFESLTAGALERGRLRALPAQGRGRDHRGAAVLPLPGCLLRLPDGLRSGLEQIQSGAAAAGLPVPGKHPGAGPGNRHAAWRDRL